MGRVRVSSHIDVLSANVEQDDAACRRAGVVDALCRVAAVVVVCGAMLGVVTSGAAHAATNDPVVPTAPVITAPQPPQPGASDSSGDIKLQLSLPGSQNSGKGGNQSILVIAMLTVLAVAPSLLVLLTGFTRLIVVLSLTRNALGLQGIPPNQVLAGLALFLSLFVMYPTLVQVKNEAVKPYMNGEITEQVAYDRAVGPIRSFMLKNTRRGELSMFVGESGKKPATTKQVSMSALIPAFVLSELKTAFIIGFVIFIPFLIIDLVVSSALMSMGMFMLPPVLVSLPFKLLLFVMVDGWVLISHTLITSFR